MRRAGRAARAPILSMVAAFSMLATVAPATGYAQQGDQASEEQPGLPPDLVVPAAPVVPPDRALDTIVVKPGFRVELVAAEPLVEDPVAIEFDEDGRLFVVEMRGYMPDVDGAGERAPVGRVVVLDDEDGDGAFDSSTIFVDHLVLPRAIAIAHGGVLVIEPPDLLFFRDRDGDGRADEMLVLETGFGGLQSPEHAGNGLLRGIDNWIHLSQHPFRFRFDGERIVTQKTPGHGQWGIAKDDEGRIFYTTNSDPLRADLVPLHYASRNPHLSSLDGVNVRVSHDFDTWPIRMTPGVNRGYREGTLRDDFTLARVTGACGPEIYRGDLFPPEHRGDAFVCEPCGNLIKRCVIAAETGADGERLVGRAAYERSDFLASTDERFRPVNLRTGPDGCLYVADMYRGVIQHRIFVTSFLREQVIDRGLERPIGLGRIYRVVPEGAAPRARPRLSSASDDELVRHLANPQGWWRDTAQRLLVERRAAGVEVELRASTRPPLLPVTRVHALWTLEGLGLVTLDDVEAAAADESPLVRRTALRLVEAFLDAPRALAVVALGTGDADGGVRVQAVLSLGASRDPRALELMVAFLDEHAASPRSRSAAASGLFGWELEVLTDLLALDAWAETGPGRDDVVRLLVDCIYRSGDRARLTELVELAATRAASSPWQAIAVLSALGAHLRVDGERPRNLVLLREPRGWPPVAPASDDLARCFDQLDARLAWPGRDGTNVATIVLSALEVERVEHGKRLYAVVCASCHQADGRGQPGTAPSLSETEGVDGSEERLVRILLHGLGGELTVDGQVWNADMPRSAAPSDEQIAALLTYVRRSFGNDAPPVSAETVRGIRRATSGRYEPWTEEELRRLP